MKNKFSELLSICKSQNFNVSLTYQKINDCSIEIYRGYGDSYKCLFYTDGHTLPKKAIKKALKFIKILNKQNH